MSFCLLFRERIIKSLEQELQLVIILKTEKQQSIFLCY